MTARQRRVIWTRAMGALLLAYFAYLNREAFDQTQVVLGAIAVAIAIFVTLMQYRDAGSN